MGSKSMIKWSKNITPSLVSQLIRAEKNVQKAILIFDSATAEYANGFRHGHNTFRVMLSRLVSANQFRLAEELLDRMKKEKCDITEENVEVEHVLFSPAMVCRSCVARMRIFYPSKHVEIKVT